MIETRVIRTITAITTAKEAMTQVPNGTRHKKGISIDPS